MTTNSDLIKTQSTVEAAQEYVRNLLEQNIPKEAAFVKYGKTKKTLKSSLKLSNEIEMSEHEKKALQLAVIFTDSGFSKSLHQPFSHSTGIAEDWLKANGEVTFVKDVTNCLLVRSKQKEAETLLEKVYEDAQNSVFAAKKYIKSILPQIQLQDQLNRHNPIQTGEWLKEHRKSLKNIDFNTPEAKERYKEGIKRNAAAIKVLRKRSKKRIPVYTTPLDNSKGAQMMFKASLRNHIDLTSIADNKASIMLSINAIIITIAMPLLIRYMGSNEYLIIPMVTLMITCVVSIIFAALATRPIKTDGESNVDKVMERNSSNLFFFGNFFSIPLEDYQRGIKQVIRSGEVLERSVINDLYFLGLALGHKFKLLRVCYMVFMVGIALAVVSYGLVLWFTAV